MVLKAITWLVLAKPNIIQPNNSTKT